MYSIQLWYYPVQVKYHRVESDPKSHQLCPVCKSSQSTKWSNTKNKICIFLFSFFFFLVQVNLCEPNPCGQNQKCIDHGTNISCECIPGLDPALCAEMSSVSSTPLFLLFFPPPPPPSPPPSKHISYSFSIYRFFFFSLFLFVMYLFFLMRPQLFQD